MENTNKNIRNILLAIILTVALILGITNISKATNNDTSLKSLSIEPSNYELVQDEEDKDIYRVKVNNNVSSIKVNATPNNSKSKVSVEGNESLNVGTNRVTVKVTAENGESSEYTIYVRRASTPIADETIIPNVQETVQENNNNGQTEQNSDKNQDNINEGTENENQEQENIIDENESNDIENVENEEQINENTEENNSIEENKSNKNFMFLIILLPIIVVIISVPVMMKKSHKHSKSKH